MDWLEPPLGQLCSPVLRFHVANKVHHRHRQLQVVLLAALHYSKTCRTCYVAIAGAVYELPGANGFGAGFSADDALANPAVLHAYVCEPGVQEEFNLAAQQEFLEHYSQYLVVEDCLGQRNRTKLGKVRKDFIKDFPLPFYLTAEVSHAAGGHITAGDSETFD
jgi:hypothetical protein